MGEEEKVRVKVKIAGREYTLLTAENKEHIMEVVSFVDDKIKEEKEKTGTTLDAAILVALHIADEYIKLLKEHNDIISSIEQYTKLVTEQVESFKQDQ
ncbi:MAG: cell division protein ZapA [Halobacteria archaeon]